MTILFPFYMWGNRCLEMFNSLPRWTAFQSAYGQPLCSSSNLAISLLNFLDLHPTTSFLPFCVLYWHFTLLSTSSYPHISSLWQSFCSMVSFLHCSLNVSPLVCFTTVTRSQAIWGWDRVILASPPLAWALHSSRYSLDNC